MELLLLPLTRRAGEPGVTKLSPLCSLVHEGTLVHAISVLSHWTSRLTVQVPAALLDWLKKAFSLKTSTSLVRHAYLQCMLGAFRGGWVAHMILQQGWDLIPPSHPPPLLSGDTLSQVVDFVPLLLQTVEKAAAQNSQHALLAEGVAAAVLLSRLALLETQTGEGSTPPAAQPIWRRFLPSKSGLSQSEQAAAHW